MDANRRTVMYSRTIGIHYGRCFGTTNEATADVNERKEYFIFEKSFISFMYMIVMLGMIGWV